MNLFKKKPVNLQPAIQKYEAIDSIVKQGGITINETEVSAEIIKEIWNIYPESKHKDVLSNILFYINFTAAAEQKKCDHTRLSFSIKDTDIKGVFENGRIK
ncbi:MAG: hypothetical protein LUE98_04550 [Tannerellaceae bacterium]|nr:hypothetical protein [Tannerellaceae bacterium]